MPLTYSRPRHAGKCKVFTYFTLNQSLEGYRMLGEDHEGAD